MDPQIGKTGFTMGLSIALPSAALLLAETPGSAEFIVTVMTLGVSVAFLAVVILLARRSQ